MMKDFPFKIDIKPDMTSDWTNFLTKFVVLMI